jgi:hypothetical protein
MANCSKWHSERETYLIRRWRAIHKTIIMMSIVQVMSIIHPDSMRRAKWTMQIHDGHP